MGKTHSGQATPATSGSVARYPPCELAVNSSGVPVLAFFSATLLTSSAYASLDPVWHRDGRLIEAPLSAQITGLARTGEIPPYSLAARDIGGAEVSLAWRPAAPVQLSLRWGAYGARWGDGSQMIGPGDLHLGTQARLRKAVGRGPDLWLAWDLKLPNAEQPLGTNETDTQLCLWARHSGSGWSGELGAGIWIAGHPDQLAAQDDALLVLARGSKALGPGAALAALDLRVVSARNPTDATLALGWEQPLNETLRLGAMIELGLSPAAPDQGARLWLALVPNPERS